MNTVIKLYEDELFKNYELFLYTDNSVTDCTYYRLSSSSRFLFLLILRLRKNKMAGDLILHIVNIFRRRIIECRVDGLLRGATNKGVMKEALNVYFFPMHRSTTERSDGLLAWIYS